MPSTPSGGYFGPIGGRNDRGDDGSSSIKY